MGTEQEWKLAVPEASLLDEILAWEGVRSRMTEAPRSYHMQSAYSDTPDRRFSNRWITIRRRLENETPVVCVKAPLPHNADPSVRGEWELEAEDVAAALPRLAALGAPAELLEAGPLACLWRADFRRRAVLLGFADGSVSELALDLGTLSGPARSLPLCELELELKAGGPHATLALLADLRTRFGLEPETRSKLARARTLE